jgi:ubiquitin-like modifier-activating enzyme ATG7
MTSLQFAPWSSDIELAFYAALASLKINHDKLNDSARKVLGLYEVRPGDKPERSCRMQIHGTALTTDEYGPKHNLETSLTSRLFRMPGGFYRAEGFIRNFNTIEDYKNVDRAKVLELAGHTIWDAIQDETIYSCPSLLNSFYAICFADLKKYKFTYHFVFPALHSDPPWKLVDLGIQHLSDRETQILVDAVQTWKYSVDSRQHGFFLAKKVSLAAVKAAQAEDDGNRRSPVTPGIIEELGFQWAIGSLSSFKAGFFEGVDPKDRYVCFVDPSTYDKNPGWAMRNLLVLIRHLFRLDSAQILCYRDTHTRRDIANSLVMHLASEPGSAAAAAQASKTTMPKVTGWERDSHNKLTSRTVDLASYMDPTRLADQAVDLNLKLIKWRISPNIDLDVVKNASCLLLGAGTLGSYVSRALMGWGVRKITFVDNASVSFSNPVRQPLFDFKDCLNGGVKKAQRAADVLSEIYPGVESEGYVMSVPMAGHPIQQGQERDVKQDFDELRRLIEAHDAIFLLLDTRESRWLPTVMGKAAGKIVMNAALGFDTFVVMRHGVKTLSSPSSTAQNAKTVLQEISDALSSKTTLTDQEKAQVIEGEELGCYFCNDVVAPADSLRDATLDQQCTVTRPGIAPLASSLLVELFVSVLQHPLKARAPASTGQDASAAFATTEEGGAFKHPLGAVPHTIRGFLSNFSNMQVTGKPYDCCSACSDRVTERYKKDGWEFVKRVLNEKGYVEEVSGLAEVQRQAEKAEEDVDWDEEEGDGELV